ncbi:MAG: hypothetical protein QNK04_15275 [Myxococcota bacterium]|nr:hypothetical protein [Myxococcota bacterium]
MTCRGPGLRRAPLAFASLLALTLADTAGAAEGGIVLAPDPVMLLSLLVLFVVLVFPVNALLFRPIFAALDARDEKIAGTRARAQQLAAEADAALRRYEEEIRTAREEAEQERRENLAEARAQSLGEAAESRAEAEREIDGARRTIQGELTDARSGLQAEAERLAREVASSVLGRPLG